MVQVGAQRELSTVGGQVLGEAVGGAGGVGAHQDVPLAVGAARADLGGQLGQRVVEHRDVVGGGVGAGITRAQQPDQRVPGARRAVVDVGQQRMKPEGLSSRSALRTPCPNAR